MITFVELCLYYGTITLLNYNNKTDTFGSFISSALKIKLEATTSYVIIFLKYIYFSQVLQ